MFAKDTKTLAPEGGMAAAASGTWQPANGNAARSIISRDLKVKGDLICKGDIQIDGEVEGDIQSGSITIGEGADVRGTIAGDSIRIQGSVSGQLKGQSVVLAKTAKVTGDVVHQSLSVEAGAFFEGQCRRSENA